MKLYRTIKGVLLQHNDAAFVIDEVQNIIYAEVLESAGDLPDFAAIEAAAKLAGLEAAEHGKFEIEEDLRARSPSRLRLLTPPGLRSAAILRRRIEAGLIRTFAGHTAQVLAVAFSPDGRSALSGSGDRTLKLWDVATGRELSTLAGHTAAVTSVAFSPDGGSVLSGSADESLKLWDVATGKEIQSFTGHADSVGSVVFSPDGRSALSGSHDMSLKLWNLPVRG